MPQRQRVVVLGVVPWSIVHFRGPLLQAMVAHGHEVTACAMPTNGTMLAAIKDLGVGFREVPFDRTGLNPGADYRAMRALVRILREVRPDVVLSYTIKPVVYGSLAARIARVPRIFSMIEGLGSAFGTDPGFKRSLIRCTAKALYRVALRHNSRVFFLNPDDRAAFARFGLLPDPGRSVLLDGIGVDLEHYGEAPLPNDMAFLFMGRFLREKGIRDYVRAARLVKARHPGVAFRLVGSIDRSSRSAISRRELDGWVDEGVVENLGRLDDVRPALARSSVFVLPSYYPEGQPRTIMEAMAMGRPIITTDSPGCRETVEPGRNGYLVPPRDVAALAASMERFIDDPERIGRMGRESRRIAEGRYDVHATNRVIMEAMELV